jgi:RNA polymerase sigma factor (sigma-70 family)
MFATEGDVIAVIKILGDYYQPKTSSIISLDTLLNRSNLIDEPFRSGFLERIEERLEIVKRLQALEPLKKKLLFLWYYETKPVTEISKELGISRMHCYRIRKQALSEILGMSV